MPTKTKTVVTTEDVEQPLADEMPSTKPAPKRKAAKPKRRIRREGETVFASHPRLHPDVGRATLTEDFSRDGTYAHVKFEDDPETVVTVHRVNVHDELPA